MSGTSSIVLVITFICLCVGLAGTIAGGIGHSWWKTDNTLVTVEIGLWRACTTTKLTDQISCVRRDGILKFDKHKHRGKATNITETINGKIHFIQVR